MGRERGEDVKRERGKKEWNGKGKEERRGEDKEHKKEKWKKILRVGREGGKCVCVSVFAAADVAAHTCWNTHPQCSPSPPLYAADSPLQPTTEDLQYAALYG